MSASGASTANPTRTPPAAGWPSRSATSPGFVVAGCADADSNAEEHSEATPQYQVTAIAVRPNGA
jgi:hypothetical protein